MSGLDALKKLKFLDPHQVEGISWIISRFTSYLAHAPGAGKTCQAIIAACLTPGPGKILFIVPPNLTANWVREIDMWVERYTEARGWSKQLWCSVSVVPRSECKDYTGWAADIIVCPDSMITKPWVREGLAATPTRFIAVDEASRFKDPNAQRTIALFGGELKGRYPTKGLIHKVQRVVLMDGSPMPNRPMEIWAPTFALAPHAIKHMDQYAFGHRYCGPTMNDYGKWEFNHSSNEAELKERLQKNFMHVVTEEQLNHPERKRSLLFMNKDARSPECKAWEAKNLSKLKLEEIDENASQGDLATFRQELGIKKVPWIVDYVADRLKNKNESILLFAWHREVCKKLYEGLLDFYPHLLVGGTDSFCRELMFESFQKGERKLIVGNILAMGRGHNLQRADRVIFAEYSWCDETNKQAEKRTSRKGSTKEFVRCEYIVAPNSMDEVILKSVMRKAETVRKVIG